MKNKNKNGHGHVKFSARNERFTVGHVEITVTVLLNAMPSPLALLEFFSFFKYAKEHFINDFDRLVHVLDRSRPY